MSGGHFNYNQYKIREIADSIHLELDRMGKEKNFRKMDMRSEWYETYPEERYHTVYSPEIVEKFKEAVISLRQAEVYAQRIDWYLSGDDGDATFLLRLEQDLTKLKKEIL